MKRILIILFSGILLIPVLVLCFVNRKKRIKYWHRFNRDLHTYPALPCPTTRLTSSSRFASTSSSLLPSVWE